MFNLARNNHNEWSLGDLLEQYASDSEVPLRSEVFIATTVWPPHLGFKPTSHEISESLLSLRTAYVDLYMMHWPA
jgi:2,5-diketo-D-gluconate reductase B